MLACRWNLLSCSTRISTTLYNSWPISKSGVAFGLQGELGNWRPVVLQDTMYKLFAGVLSGRLRAWIRENKILCRAQKGFIGYDGAAECNLSLEAARDDARMRRRTLFICWLDLRNAYGTVPRRPA